MSELPNSHINEYPSGTINDFIGLLAGKTKKIASLEEIREATICGWTGLPIDSITEDHNSES